MKLTSFVCKLKYALALYDRFQNMVWYTEEHCIVYIYNLSSDHICWGTSLKTSSFEAFLALLVHTQYIVCAETFLPPPVYPGSVYQLTSQGS